MAKSPDHFCECCQAEWYSSQISERSYEANLWRCPSCGEWADADIDERQPIALPHPELSERDRNLVVAALHFFALRFRGSPTTPQLLGIYELAATPYGLPSREEIDQLCERIHPACSLVI